MIPTKLKQVNINHPYKSTCLLVLLCRNRALKICGNKINQSNNIQTEIYFIVYICKLNHLS